MIPQIGDGSGYQPRLSRQAHVCKQLVPLGHMAGF